MPPYQKREGPFRGRGKFNNNGRGNDRGRGRRNFQQQGRDRTGGNACFSNTSDLMKITLKLVIEKNQVFDRSIGKADLSNMLECQDVGPIKNSIDFNSMTFCKSLASALVDYGTLIQLSLRNNRLATLQPLLRALKEADVHKNLEVLDAGDNNINKFDFIGELKDFRQLQDLNLSGTPISKEVEYSGLIKNKLPHIRILDGSLVERSYLSLPNPVGRAYNSEYLETANVIASFFIPTLESKNDRLISEMYAPNAIFSLSKESRFNFSCVRKNESINKNTIGAYAQLRQIVGDKSNNLITNARTYWEIRPSPITAFLIKGIYNSNFALKHHIFKDANITRIADSPLTTISFHGTMTWQHEQEATVGQTAFFDRSVVLFNNNGQWRIINDCLHIRTTVQDNPLFYASDPKRIEKLSRSYSAYPKEALEEIVNWTTSDAQFYKVVNTLPSEDVVAVLSQSGNNPTILARVAWYVSEGQPVQEAFVKANTEIAAVAQNASI